MTTIKAISISKNKGTRKQNIAEVRLIPGHGLENDAHAGKWHRQVSLLAEESIKSMRDKGLEVVAGNFAENITTEGVDLTNVSVGQHLSIGDCQLIISQLGKICHNRCAIYHQAGDCVMPREGVFAVILKGGMIHVGETIDFQQRFSPTAAVIGDKKTFDCFHEQLQKWQERQAKPIFIRLDQITEKQGGTLSAILDDLTNTQKINDIVVFDPDGNLDFSLMSFAKLEKELNVFEKNYSRIFHCRTVGELPKLSNTIEPS